MITGTFLMLTSCVAWSTATLPWLWLSRVSVTSLQPPTPPASLKSRNAISTDLAPAWPYSPAGPVSSMTRPTVMSQSAAKRRQRRSRRAPSATVRGKKHVSSCAFPSVVGPLRAPPLVDAVRGPVARRSGRSLVEIVFHDRAVAAVPVALERIDIALELVGARPAPRRSRAWSVGVSASWPMARFDARWSRVARADDDARPPPGRVSMAALATVAMSTPCRSAIAAQRRAAAPGTGPSRRSRR